MDEVTIKHGRLIVTCCKNHTTIPDCKLCMMEKRNCDDFCLLAGHHFYIGKIEKLSWWRSFLEILRNLFHPA